MIILHGDNTTKSRARLAALIDEAKKQSKELVRLEAKSLQLANLEEALGATSLFGEDKLVVIEGLHSLPTSKRKKELISYLATSTLNPDPSTLIVLYEKRPLTATMIKKLGNPKAEEFKITNSLFKWLDSLGTSNKQVQLKLLQAALESDGDQFCYLMLVRQVIQASDGGRLSGPPFLISKLKSQANKFTLAQLLSLHAKLFALDVAQKTSTLKLSLAQELELLAINM